MDRNRLKTFAMYAFCMSEYTRRVLNDSPRHKKMLAEMAESVGMPSTECNEVNAGLFYLGEVYANFEPLCDLSKKEFKSLVDELVAEKRIIKTGNPQYPLYKARPPKYFSDMSPEEIAEHEAKHGPAPKSPLSELGEFQKMDLQTGEICEMTKEEVDSFKSEQERWKKMTPEERKAERMKPENQPSLLPNSFPHPDREFYE